MQRMLKTRNLDEIVEGEMWATHTRGQFLELILIFFHTSAVLSSKIH